MNADAGAMTAALVSVFAVLTMSGFSIHDRVMSGRRREDREPRRRQT